MKYNVIKDLEFIKESLKLSDNKFSFDSGIPRSSIDNWKNERNNISKQMLEKFYSFAYENNLRINNLKEQMYKDSANKKEIYLFHGAKKNINDYFSLEYANAINDFGKGIYFGESLMQSALYVAPYDDSSVYICKCNTNDNLSIKEYDVNLEWMLTIAYFRKRLQSYKNNHIINNIIKEVENTDVVIAPIADNNMYQIIEDFINGIITDKQCIASLSATDLGKQYVFLNEKALKNISIVERCYLCQLEKEDYIRQKSERSNIGLQKVKYVTREYAGKGKYIEEILNERL